MTAEVLVWDVVAEASVAAEAAPLTAADFSVEDAVVAGVLLLESEADGDSVQAALAALCQLSRALAKGVEDIVLSSSLLLVIRELADIEVDMGVAVLEGRVPTPLYPFGPVITTVCPSSSIRVASRCARQN